MSTPVEPQAAARGRSGAAVALVAAVAAIGGLLFGYDTGVISGAILFIKRDFALGAAMEGLAVAAVTAGALVGAFAAGASAEALGRRATNVGAGILFVASSIVCALAPGTDALVGGRFLVGVAIGLASVAAPMYIAEVAPARSRGTLVSVFQLAITVGILGSYAVDTALARAAAWRWMLGLAAVPGALLALGMLPLPDSPRWLVKRGREEEARAALGRVRAPEEVEPELREIRSALAAERAGTWADLLDPALRAPLVVGIGLAVLQQVTGINAVIYYAPQIFQRAGFASDAVALAATMGIGAINVLATFIAISLVDRVGRRPLLLVGVLGMVGALAALAIAFGAEGSAQAGRLGVVTALGLAAYVVCFAFSLGPVVWLMIAEIYPYRNRPQAVALSTAANWGANFAVSLSFPLMQAGLGPAATFWTYAALGLATLAFVWLRVPETKGRTLEQISASWRLPAGRVGG